MGFRMTTFWRGGGEGRREEEERETQMGRALQDPGR